MHAPDDRHFVPEIEGLRAVAAVLVAVYHVFLGRVSGGVDVFFVIAGFLITTSLLRRTSRDGRVDAGQVLARLAARLLPVAILVLVAVAIATAAWLPVTRQLATYREVAASALYVENWALAIKAVDYVARDEARSPVQHFWAMSVQGQFYLAWLVLFAVIGRLGGLRHLRATLAVALATIFAASLAFSVVLTAENQPLAYFHTGARMWEFAAGGLLAVVVGSLAGRGTRMGRARAPLGLAAGWLGIAMIVSCGLVIRVSAQFPGSAALWPVAGAVLVVAAAGTGGRWSSSRLLASRPLVWIGGFAYALYLWHWPVLIVARGWLDHEGSLGLPEGLAVLAVALILAVVSTRLVERPLRIASTGAGRPRRVLVPGLAAVLAVALVASVAGVEPPAPVTEAMPDASIAPGAAALGPRPTPAGSGGALPIATGLPVQAEPDDDAWDDAWWSSDGSDSDAEPGSGAGAAAEATVPRSRTADPKRKAIDVVPDLRTAKADRNSLYPDGCQQTTLGAPLIICERGDTRGKVTALLVGGSHATHWFPPLNRIAKHRGWRLLTAVKGSCRFLTGPFGDDEGSRTCRSWIGDLMAEIERDPPDVIITTATVTHPDGERVPPGYVEMWRRLDRLGIAVVGIRDTPRGRFDRVDCLAVHTRNVEACDIDRSPTMDAVNPAALLEDLPDNVILADVTDYVCTPEVCPAVVGNVVVYRDRHHLTATYAMTLSPMLADQIPRDPAAVHRANEAARR